MTCTLDLWNVTCTLDPAEITCSLCVLNELLEPFSLHHGCCAWAQVGLEWRRWLSVQLDSNVRRHESDEWDHQVVGGSGWIGGVLQIVHLRRFVFKPKYWTICLNIYFFVFILLFTSSSPCRKDQFAISYFSTSIIVLIQVYNWEIRHHSLVCCCGFADILNILW